MIEETKELEQENEDVAVSDAQEDADEVLNLSEPLPELVYTEVFEENRSVPRKKRRRGLVTFVILAVFAVLGTIAFGLELLNAPQIQQLQNATELPEGAVVPVFTPINPTEFLAAASDELIVVPDETGLELPPDNEMSASAPVTPQNHYVQTPNVSEFYARAAQDESYVYFLKRVPSADKFGLNDLMRMKISNGKTEPVTNANEISGSIYSFTLWGQNMITCEFNRNTKTFAFYRVPKTFEDAQLLFEQDFPALMNVYDNKIFMFFSASQKLGVFDPETDKQPSFIDMSLGNENESYLPEFSVVNGYLYYGIWYSEDEHAEYFRRSLFTGETVMLLASNGGDGSRILNLCWDEVGNAYYWLLEHETDTFIYSLAVVKNEAASEILSTFESYDGNISPTVALKDEFLVVASVPGAIYKYDRYDYSLELEAAVKEPPYAVTKDFLIAPDGIYRIFDLNFTSFIAN